MTDFYNPVVDWDRLAIENRRPSSRDNCVLRVGFVVKHFMTNKPLRIVDIDFWGGAHDVGGHTIVTEPATDIEGSDYEGSDGESDDGSESPSDEGCMDDERVYASDYIELNGEFEETSFCERCFINFTYEFVVWSRTWLDLHHPWRGQQRLLRHNSSCRRCEACIPTGRVLWRFLKQRVAFEKAAWFWFGLAHHPKYATTHKAAMDEDMESFTTPH